jgi:hypothetical protein
VQFVHDGVKVPLRVDCSAIITSPRSLVRGRFVPGYSSSEIVVRRPELEAALAALTGKQVTIEEMKRPGYTLCPLPPQPLEQPPPPPPGEGLPLLLRGLHRGLLHARYLPGGAA